MHPTPLRILNDSSTALLLGGQASAWQLNLSEYNEDAAMIARLNNLIQAAQVRVAPLARQLGQILPGANERLRNITGQAEAIDVEPAVSVPGIFLSHLASLHSLAAMGLKEVPIYAHSQAVISKEVAPLAAENDWASNTDLVDHLAFSILLGAATSQQHFGRMLAVRGVPAEVLRDNGIALAVVNTPDKVVISGSEEELAKTQAAIEKLVDEHNALIDSHEIGGEPIVLGFEDLGVSSAFHHPILTEAAQQTVAWSEELDLNVNAAQLAQEILVDEFVWEVGDEDYFLSLDKALIPLTRAISDAVIIDASTPAQRDKLATPGETIPTPVDYSRFAPRKITLPGGKTVLSTAFSHLTGNSPILLAGMTPTTVDADIVAAAANAGHWAEMAGGGQYSDEVFNANNDNLQAQLLPGRASQFNSMFFDRFMWNLQFGQQRIVSKARAAGSAITGVTISAGIPELEEAEQLINDLHADGFPYIAFKPGTAAQIRSVLAIAEANPDTDIIMQVEDGHAGGHHSWVDLDDLLLSTYRDIREHDNVVLVVGGGIGTPERAAEYLTGAWAHKYGRSDLPVDGILVGTAAMATKEAKTSPQVKEALVATPGIPEGWVGRLKTNGGMTSGQSHLLADLYELDNDFAAASRLITSLDPDTYAEHADEIIEAINKTSKPYFGDVDTMTYAEWVERFVELAYPFTDPSWDDRFFDLVHRVEARLSDADHGEIETLFPDIAEMADAPAVVDKLLAAYPQAREITVSPRDAAWFIALNRKHHKPMPWVPAIDGDLKRWFGLDSLWQSQDDRYPANGVRVIPGPISVAGIDRIDEPVADLLGRFEEAGVEAVAGEPAEAFSRLADTARETIIASPTISWHGHLIANPAHDLAPEAYELIEDEDGNFTLRVIADTYWESLPEDQRPFAVAHVDIPIDLPDQVHTGASPIVSEERLPDAVFALLAGVAGVGSTSAAGDEITALPTVDEDGEVHASFHFAPSLPRTHAGVAGGDRDEIVPDVLVGPCWPAIYTALGTGELEDGYPVIEGLLNAVHLDHVIDLLVPIEELANGREITVTSRCASIAESASGRIVTVELELYSEGNLVATMMERFAIRGRAQGTNVPVPAPEFGGGKSSTKIEPTPRSFVDRAYVTAPSDMTPFATVTGDYNPIHTSTNAAQLVGLEAPLVHGMWLSASAEQVVSRHGDIVGWTYSMYGMVQLNDEVEITVERIGRAGLHAALEITCRIDGEVVSRGQALLAQPRVAYVYPGQGIQSEGMGTNDRNTSAAARAAWERADAHTREALGFSIIDVIDNNPTHLRVGSQEFIHPEGVLNLTQFTQVALAVLAYGQTERLREANAISSNSMYAGHSLGEYTALASLGDIFDLEAVIDIVYSRGSAMGSLVPRDENGRSNYGLGALRPNMVGVSADEVADYVAKVAADADEYLEIVNYNIEGQQYSVAGTVAGLKALKAATAAINPKAFVMIPGIDVPFHSSVLRPGVPAFAEKLDELLPKKIDISALVDRYVPNLVARPFELTQEFVDSILEVVPATKLENLDIDAMDEQELARLLLIELLSWQFASPVRWIETQALLIDSVDEIVEVGLAASPTLTNLAQRTMNVIGKSIPVYNVERDQEIVQRDDVTAAPAVETPADEVAEEELNVAEAALAAPVAEAAPAAPAPAPAAGGSASDAPELGFDAAHAIDVLFALQNKLRVDQIEDKDTTEILTGGVSSRRNQLLMDMSAELGVAAIDGAADAEVSVLHERVNTAAPTYGPFGPVLGEAVTARLRSLVGVAGLKPNYVGEYVTGSWSLPASWVPHVEAAILLGTREGDSFRGGTLGSLPEKVSSKADVNALIDAAIAEVAAENGTSVSKSGGSAGGTGAQVDSAALNEFAESITGYEGILASTARSVLKELGHLPEQTVEQAPDTTIFEAMDAELGSGWLKLVEPAFDAKRAIEFNDAWAIAREKLARVALGELEAEPAEFIGAGDIVERHARWWAAKYPERAALLTAIADAAATPADEPLKNDVAIVTGAAPGSIASAVVEKLLAQGATVVMTASRVDTARKEFARKLYTESASPNATLWLVPANLSSFRDIDALTEWIGTTQKASVGGKTVVTKEALAPTLLFPFAAPRVHGILSEAGPAQENQARLLLWSVERLIADAAKYQNLGRVHVVLPGSPNRGTFGGDGAYGEVKAGLDAIVNKWSVESGWPEKVSLAHAHIGWVSGTNLMGGNDRLIPKATEAGIHVYSTDEISDELMNLVTEEARAEAKQAPLEADFTGGLADANVSIADLAREAAEEAAAAQEDEAEPTEDVTYIKALPTPEWPTQPGAIDTNEITEDLDDMVVIVGIGEVSSWGSGRTRFEAEVGIQRDGTVDLTAAGVIELAWMMGLITWKEDPAPGWYDTDDKEVAEEDIFDRYRDEVVARAGIRQLTDKYFLKDQGSIDVASVFLDRDVEFTVPTEAEAQDYLEADPEFTTIAPTADGEWKIIKTRGAVAHIPKNATLSRTVAGQMPDDFDPSRWGIPASMLDGLDRIAVWNLVTAVDAFLNAGFSPAELLQSVHPGLVSSTQGTGIGGMESLHKVFVSRFLGEDRPSDILQEALPNVVAAHVMQSFIGGYGQMVHPVAACATAAVSVEEAVDKIKLGKSDVVIAGGIDDVQVESLTGFGDMNATAETQEMLDKGIDPRFISRANDARRGGFLEAEGGGTVILARGSVAKELGLPVYAVVAHAQSYADGAHTSIPAPGLGALGAGRGGENSQLARSLRALGLTPDDVTVVSKHDTSTNANDPNESQLHSRLWTHIGRNADNPLFVVSQKSLTGHAKGGAALFQMGGMIDIFNHSLLPGNISLDVVDKAIEPKAKPLVWLKEPLKVDTVKAAVLTSLGFGHVSAVVVLAHPGIFAAVAGDDWREAATQRLRSGRAHFERGMIGRDELYTQPQDRRLPEHGADEVEIAMILDEDARLGENGFFE